MKYLHVFYQMACIIGLGSYAGYKLDAYNKNINFPIYTITLSLLSIAFAIYVALKDFLKPPKT